MKIPEDKLRKIATLFNASFTSITEEQITEGLITATERAAKDDIGLVAVISAFTIEILSETKVRRPYVTGATNLFNYPEYRDADKAQQVLNYLSDGVEIMKLPVPEEEGQIKIVIGPENLSDELKESSVVVASYDAGDDMKGLIGVVGPTRMDYSKVAAKLSVIARGLSRALSFEQLPTIKDNHLIKGEEVNEQSEETG